MDVFHVKIVHYMLKNRCASFIKKKLFYTSSCNLEQKIEILEKNVTLGFVTIGGIFDIFC
jgi:hypothetical protein